MSTPMSWAHPDEAHVADIAAGLDRGVAETVVGPTERALRSRVRAVLEAYVVGRAQHWDRTGDFAGPAYRALADAGLGGLIFPTQWGGQECGTLAYAMAVEEIAAACPATSLIYMTQTHVGYPILVAGTDEQRRRYLPGLCAGISYGALAITEPEAGSDVAGLRTTARREHDGYLLSGAKTFITTGDRADVLVVFATVDRSRGRHGITAFVVSGETAGLRRGKPLVKLGMHGSSTAELFFDDVWLPAEARLGAEGGAWELSMRAVTRTRISAAAQGVGIARAVYAHVAARLHAAGALVEPALSGLAGLARRIAAARLLLYATARATDTDPGPTPADVAVMKATCTDLGSAAAATAADLLGPFGDLADCRIEQYARDARVTRIYDGTNEIQHLIIGRWIREQIGGGTR